MKTAEQIERDFDRFFGTSGFTRVSSIVGESPEFPNADYIDLDKRSIVELKVLDKDFFSEGGIIQRFCAIVPSPVSVAPNGTVIYTVRWPDQKNREGLTDTFEEPLRRILKKANRQLKETNERLFSGDANGFVMLALNRFRSLHPNVVRRMIDELLSDEFSSIKGYCLCTVGWGVAESGIDQGILCCPSVEGSVADDIREYWVGIGRSWCHFALAGGHD
jgi:hypothetical protein